MRGRRMRRRRRRKGDNVTLDPFLLLLFIGHADLKGFVGALDDKQALLPFFIRQRLQEEQFGHHGTLRYNSTPCWSLSLHPTVNLENSQNSHEDYTHQPLNSSPHSG